MISVFRVSYPISGSRGGRGVMGVATLPTFKLKKKWKSQWNKAQTEEMERKKEGNSNITYICCDGYWMHEISSALNK